MDVLIDRWQPDRTWELFDFKTMRPAGGWRGKLLGEVTGDTYDKCLGRIAVRKADRTAKRAESEVG